MDIAQQILQVLNAQGQLELAGLGTLSLITKHAELDVQNDKILPPKKELIFNLDRGQKAENQFNALSSQILKDLLEKGNYDLAGIGKWTNFAGKINFVADSQIAGNDFYGFEEIVVPRIGADSPQLMPSSDEDYKFNKSILWIFLVVIPVAGMLYFAVTQKDKLFGKASFDSAELSKIDKKPTKPAVVDSTLAKPSDSIKVDSLTVPTNNTIK
ncbi:hypothetical protein [Soonwooa sp.]|uniref:hypothetical protein n=1 Tax=Soonwooa sp. TaxID=1938592 RepID=UPI0026019525|nr:hypothetical protein [Soonwooa sp.]